MTNWQYRNMVVPAEHQPLAAELCGVCAGPIGEGMFVVGLSPTGEAPATAYVSSGYVSEGFAFVLPLDTYVTEIDPVTGEPVIIHTHKDGDPAEVVRLAAENGLVVTEQQVADIMNAMDCTEQEPFTAFARLGLQLVQTSFPTP